MTFLSAALLFSLTTFAQNKTAPPASSPVTETVTATLYGIKTNPDKVLFTSAFQAKTEGSRIDSQVIYKDAQGQVAVTERAQLEGTQIVSYEMDRPQTQEKGAFQVKEGTIYFSYEGPDGKKKSNEEKLKGSLVSSANFNVFVLSKWDELATGKSVEVRFAVWDRLETVGFTLQKTGEPEKNGKKTMELRMKPTSFVIAALVDPVFFWYAIDSKKMQSMKGRVSPKIQENGKWKDLDATVVYLH